MREDAGVGNVIPDRQFGYAAGRPAKEEEGVGRSVDLGGRGEASDRDAAGRGGGARYPDLPRRELFVLSIGATEKRRAGNARTTTAEKVGGELRLLLTSFSSSIPFLLTLLPHQK